MRKLLSVFIALIGFSFIAVDVEARRMSGGKSIGKQPPKGLTPCSL